MTTTIKLSHYAFKEGYAAAPSYRGDAPAYYSHGDKMQWLMGRRARLEEILDNLKPRPIGEIIRDDEQVISTPTEGTSPRNDRA